MSENHLQAMLKQSDGTQLHKGTMLRHYIVSLRYQHPGEAFPIPSSRELVAMFGVARSTATLELKSMVEDGIIIGKRGIGTFTNPVQEYIFPQAQHSLPLAGLLCGDGRIFFHDKYSWSMIAQTGLELTMHHCNVNYITGSFERTSIDDIVINFKRLGLNAVVWIHPPSQIAQIAERLRSMGIALLTAETPVPGFSGVGFDIAHFSRDIAGRLLKEGRRSIAVVPSHGVTQEMEQVFSEVYREAGEDLEIRRYFRFPQKPNMQDLIQDLREGRIPDAIYAHGFYSIHVYQALAASGIPPERCRLVATRHCWPGDGFRGLLLAYPWEQHARTLAALTIMELGASGRGAAQYRRIPCDVIPVESAEDEERVKPPPLPDLSN